MSEEHAGAALPPGALVEGLTIERVLEQGRFSAAYLVRDDGQVRVLREFLPAAYVVREGLTMQAREVEDRNALRWWMRSFLDQAQVLGRLRHPALPVVQRVFEANNTAYALTEPVLGETLAALLQREGTIDEARLRRILQSLLEGLERAHAVGLLHRDIRPQNVMVRPDGTAALLDFAVLRTAVRFKSGLLSGAGVAPYAAPEERAANAAFGAWTDLYGLGALSYRAICGIDPAAAQQRAAGTALLPAAQATRVRASDALLGAIDHALLLAPVLRPQTVADWRAELRAESAATVAMPLGAKKPKANSRSGTRLALPMLLIALAGAAYWAYSRLPRPVSASAPPADAVAAVSPPVVAAPAAVAPAAAPATPTAAGTAADAPSSLDRLALDLMSKDRKAQDALRDQKLQQQRDEDERERKAREAALHKPEPEAAAEKTAAKPVEKPAKPAATAAADDAAASARTRQLEEEIARLKAETAHKGEESDTARAEREKNAHAAEAAAQAERDRQAQVIARARKNCRIPAPSLSTAGNLTFDTASRVPGAERLSSGAILLPPVTTSDGDTRQFEVTADSCARLVN